MPPRRRQYQRASVANITAGDKIRWTSPVSVTVSRPSRSKTSVRRPSWTRWRLTCAPVRRPSSPARPPRIQQCRCQWCESGCGRQADCRHARQAETVTITAVNGASVDVRPALARDHRSGNRRSFPVRPGPGGPAEVQPSRATCLSAPGERGSASPPQWPLHIRATARHPARYRHHPRQAAGQGPCIDTAVRDQAVTMAGYQDTEDCEPVVRRPGTRNRGRQHGVA